MAKGEGMTVFSNPSLHDLFIVVVVVVCHHLQVVCLIFSNGWFVIGQCH